MDLKDTALQALNELIKNGGEGSGDFDHAGRPGLVGGSEPVESREKRGFKSKSERKEVKDITKEEHKQIEEKVSKMSDEELIKTHFDTMKGFESEKAKAGVFSKNEATYGIVAQELKKRTGKSFSMASSKEEIERALKTTDLKRDELVRQAEENKDKLDIKKTTVTTKAGKKREIEYVESVPDGFKELKGATTAPLGYTWYTNGKSILDKSRKSILVKDKANNSLYKHEYIEY